MGAAFTGAHEATAEAIAARRANSRREMPLAGFSSMVFPSKGVGSGVGSRLMGAQRRLLNPRMSVN